MQKNAFKTFDSIFIRFVRESGEVRLGNSFQREALAYIGGEGFDKLAMVFDKLYSVTTTDALYDAVMAEFKPWFDEYKVRECYMSDEEYEWEMMDRVHV